MVLLNWHSKHKAYRERVSNMDKIVERKFMDRINNLSDEQIVNNIRSAPSSGIDSGFVSAKYANELFKKTQGWRKGGDVECLLHPVMRDLVIVDQEYLTPEVFDKLSAPNNLTLEQIMNDEPFVPDEKVSESYKKYGAVLAGIMRRIGLKKTKVFANFITYDTDFPKSGSMVKIPAGAKILQVKSGEVKVNKKERYIKVEKVVLEDRYIEALFDYVCPLNVLVSWQAVDGEKYAIPFKEIIQ